MDCKFCLDSFFKFCDKGRLMKLPYHLRPSFSCLSVISFNERAKIIHFYSFLIARQTKDFAK